MDTIITDGITAGIEIRRQRGLEIAALSKIIRKSDGIYTVPSQTNKGRYTVRVGQTPHCTCADHEIRGCRCKHIYAAEYAIKREQHADGTQTVTERLTITETVQRPTHAQDWPAYNAAQQNEKRLLQSMLSDLCKTIQEAPQTKGRPRLPLADAVFAVVFKVYSTFSGRRFTSDLCDAQAKGYLSKVPHYNSVFDYFEDERMSDTLTGLIEKSSLPLRAIEQDFAVDSTGFTSSRFVKWFDHKYGAARQKHDWCKAHVVCGVKTNVATAVEIYDRDASDTKILPSMLETTVRNGFNVREVSADKGYSSINNHNEIERHGATPFIAFKANATGTDNNASGAWTKMFHYFSFKREEFLAHYHKRSNVESTMMMIKTKFGDDVRSRTDLAMKNEVLAKILCHNICCLISAMYELGIEPMFGDNDASENACPKSLPSARKMLPC